MCEHGMVEVANPSELFLAELVEGIEIQSNVKFIVSVMTIVLFVVYARVKPLHVFRPIFTWIAQGMANVNELIDWALVPVMLVFKTVFKVLFFILRPLGGLFPKREQATGEACLAPANGDSEKHDGVDEP